MEPRDPQAGPPGTHHDRWPQTGVAPESSALGKAGVTRQPHLGEHWRPRARPALHLVDGPWRRPLAASGGPCARKKARLWTAQAA
jgi:hypothetical protein